jgi:hypothetical protein
MKMPAQNGHVKDVPRGGTIHELHASYSTKGNIIARRCRKPNLIIWSAPAAQAWMSMSSGRRAKAIFSRATKSSHTFSIAGVMPHGSGDPFLQSLSHLHDLEPDPPTSQGVGHEGSELVVDAGGHGDGFELCNEVLEDRGFQGEPRHRRKVGGGKVC